MYLAQDLEAGACHPDPDEFLTRERIPFDTLVHAVMTGELQDAKTVAAVLKTKFLLGR
jgi:ADP-ribose pyrophosphatase